MANYKRETMVNAGFTAPALTLARLDAAGIYLGAKTRSEAVRMVIDVVHDSLPKSKRVKP